MYVTANGIEEVDGKGPNEAEVRACLDWLAAHASPSKTIRARSHSYRLKHDVERWLRASGSTLEATDALGRVFVGAYVSNGAFIAAAIRAGYRAKRIGRTLNATFNIALARP